MKMIPSIVVIASLTWSAGELRAGAKDRTLDIFWVDSMGGGSTLVVTPAGESILFDTGNPGGRDSARIHQVATAQAGLKKIDHLVTTHLHIDHFGGAPELAKLMPIGVVYDNGIPDQDPDGRRDPSWPVKIRGYREMKVDRRVVVSPGEVLPVHPVTDGPDLKVRFIAAKQKASLRREVPNRPGECRDANPKPVDTSDNANSVVTLIQFGGFRFVDGGDLTWNTEAELVCPVQQIGSVDVYQVNHHGLDVSNNPLWVRALAPTVSVMNNGPEKGCGPETFRTLKSVPTLQAMYQVHRNVRKDSEFNTLPEMCANHGKESGGNFIQLTVAPNGRSYTVRIPSTGHSREFQTRW